MCVYVCAPARPIARQIELKCLQRRTMTTTVTAPQRRSIAHATGARSGQSAHERTIETKVEKFSFALFLLLLFLLN